MAPDPDVDVAIAVHYSPDGTWWWDGAAWRPTVARRSPFRLTRNEIVVAALYVALWVAGLVWCAVSVPAANSDGADPSPVVVVTGIALVATAALGALIASAWLGARGRWRVVLLLTAWVCAWFLTLYVAAMLAVPVPQGQSDVQDDAAAVGLVLLVIPTVAVVVAITGLGTAVGATYRRVRRARRTRVSGTW